MNGKRTGCTKIRTVRMDVLIGKKDKGIRDTGHQKKVSGKLYDSTFCLKKRVTTLVEVEEKRRKCHG